MKLIIISPKNSALELLTSPGGPLNNETGVGVEVNAQYLVNEATKLGVIPDVLFYDCSHINQLLSLSTLYDNEIYAYSQDGMCTLPDKLHLDGIIAEPGALVSLVVEFLSEGGNMSPPDDGSNGN